MKQKLSLLLSLGYCTLSQGFFLDAAIAQVAPDGTTNTTVNVNSNDFTIEQGERAGGNLFHSFSEFSVPTDGSAFFNNAADIVNIFSRVTGGNISNIDGLLGANGAANLFLINPAGIIFGEGARLDIGGSFFGSTADSIIFPNGEFSATNLSNPPLLTINAPIGLNFRDNPADIINRSVADDVGLQVPSGKNFTLVGGDINLEAGKITAPGGIINLGGLSTAGEITINLDSSLVFPDGVTRSDISLSDQAEVSVKADGGGFINVNARNLTLSDQSLLSGGIAENTGSVNAQAGDITINATSVTARGNSIISTATDGVGNAGNINITTNTLEFNDEFSSEERAAQFDNDDFSSRLVASTFGQGNAGNITVNAEGNVSFDGSGGGIFSTVGLVANDDAIPNVKGDAGNILVNANSVSITNGAGFIVSTIGEGNGGNITVNARDTITMDGLGDPIRKFSDFIRPSGLKTQVRGQEDATADNKEQVGPGIGNGGIIEINTNVLSASRVNIQADSSGGNAGNIIINAESIIIEGVEGAEGVRRVTNSLFTTQVQTSGQGEGGDLRINTKDLRLVDSLLLADNKGEGNAGQIIIDATNSISLEDTPQVDQGSQLVSGTEQSGNETQGNAGDIIINSGSLSLQGDSFISTQVNGMGDAGDINIKASGDVSITDNSQLATEILRGAEGDSGDINIDAKSLTIQGVGRILADNQGTGNAGNVTIKATDSVVLNTIEPTTDSADSDSTEQTTDLVRVRRPTVLIISQIQSNVEGEGGDINISASSISLNNFALISTNTAEGSVGNAGNITLNATDRITINNGSVIDALTETDSNGGNININANLLELINGGKIVTGNDQGGNAGNITINITGDIILNNGNPPENSPFDELNLQEIELQTGIFANNFPDSTGNGGNIIITADSIQFEDEGSISAATVSGTGGNITLRVEDLISLRNNSLISAEAGSTGDGGNINIDTNFIVASPNQNSDILTTASQGQGGNINITTEALFGIQERPQNPITNDIDASSEFGLDGNVSINNPDLDTFNEIIEVPAIVELETLGVNACSGVRANEPSNLTIKGKGGLPSTPTEPLMADLLIPDGKPITLDKGNDLSSLIVGETETVQENTNYDPTEIKPIKTSIGDIYPARGIIKTDDGKIILTAYATDNLNTRTPHISANCSHDSKQ